MEHIASGSHHEFLGIDSLIASQAVIFRINSGKEKKEERNAKESEEDFNMKRSWKIE